MKVMNIIHDSVVDGEGLRTVVFFAGCPHHCLGCHNPTSWNLYNGIEMNVKEIIKEISKNPLTDVTFSGGDPFFQAIEVKEVAKAVKSLNKNLWIYTGYTLEEIQNSQNNDMIELLHYGDVLVDGRFEIEKRDLTLPFRGSSNQRIIRLK
ncbi:anaerobic ribonucleoside-triphosphate reductase activating protein [Bacillus toyonensis]|uniref:Anaerobic ribonucleoside-triphosphate reductase-activating protein n=1 Tax=Bacillus toyonensis TaxID=155322 RepID=A0AAP8JXK9_9BACI|nr:anaerobic ribonucleoside-triphosphate reductase activating protein [Bacillus toyonensis]MED3541544.1 anaerobic ribonucleoside-triphosphate reductase activating protein [Bacillus toyonensis]MEE2021481.1 anaerobic ribonucleoside-triphosphate reductase activating protein [Bacillus toyonensis]PEB90102.1 anaerobic ribonucleoside-triphosphate reductase activating protein [Bacillus toyonensis]PEK97741.1 anaerobic ribonucleoside-triphosphate reductase activating protein [Bacillus toyonensis]PEO2472